MASIQEVANAAYLIGQAAKDAELKTTVCASTLQTHSSQLAATVRGSRTGEDAVQQVITAQHSLQDTAARLITLQSTIDTFIQDLTK